MKRKTLIAALGVTLMLTAFGWPMASSQTRPQSGLVAQRSGSETLPAIGLHAPSATPSHAPDLGPWFSFLPLLANGQATGPGPNTFLETFDGAPINPMPWQPANWDVTVHSRDTNNPDTLTPMRADHGAQCEAPPATHPIDNYAEAVFICKGHMMTAIDEGGYGVIYLTPDAMVDFSGGTAVIKFDVSTFRASGRDWIDLWVTPFSDNLQLPLETWLPDLNGPPKRAVAIRLRMGIPSSFGAEVYRNFTLDEQDIMGTWWTSYEDLLTPSKSRRDTFELDISQNHLKFGMPQYNFWWIDEDIPNLGWTQGIVQLGHHSYNPNKACDFDGTCGPNTWHWDNVSISPDIPFTMVHATQRYVNGDTGPIVSLAAPAPANGFLRFAGIGNALEVSFDGGHSWKPAQVQNQMEQFEDHARSYWMPIPAGVSQVRFRGHDWYGGGWEARDISVWSLTTN